MKIAMLGGSFDPIHYGHIMLGRLFAEKLELDKVFIIPSKTSPHKKASQTPEQQRLEMCRLAAEYAGEVFEASDIEFRREGLSYTYYTVVSLLEQYKGCDFYLLVGADMFMTLETWHRFDELKELVTFCTVPRGDISAEQLHEQSFLLRDMGCSTYVSDQMLMQISSTELRAAIAKGEPIDGFVPPQVEDYIGRNGLYSE